MQTLMIDGTSKNMLAAHILQAGGLVAAPTETVYGLCANAFSKQAVANIFVAKGRPNDNPLIIHIADLAMLKRLVRKIPPIADTLISHFWPGPLTLIFEASDIVPSAVRAGLPTVAIRYPSNPIMQQLIIDSGLPLAAPSANTSGKPSPTNANRVFEDLNGKIDAIIDGGNCDIGIESTVLDITTTPPTILRPGGITVEMIESVIGPISIDAALLSQDSTATPKAPGMKYTHYSPNAKVCIFEGPLDLVIDAINTRIKQDAIDGKISGVLCTDETVSSFCTSNVKSLGRASHLDEIAMHLFEALRSFDDDGIDFVYSLSFSKSGIGQAIMNRLDKSAGFNIITITNKK
ncbi:MAG: L-threonylcarbamoyladenylate synthase [Cellulosilyticaceae bacterium]